MTRKQLILVAVIVVVASVVSAFVAYHRGLRRASGSLARSASPTANPSGACVGFADAAPQIGKNGCVVGRVLRVYTSRAGNTFFDFCPDYRKCPFASVVFSEDRAKFGDLGALRGQQVEIRGFITAYQGRAEIIIRDPGQIHVAP